MVIYKTRRVVFATGGLLAALAAATVFLCIRPAIPAAEAAQSGNLGAAAAAAATLALDSGALVTLADRHAGDAMRIAEDGTGPDGAEGLDWDYVQLRL